jgi:polyhydroxyalkanoate synthase subunit PhaC
VSRRENLSPVVPFEAWSEWFRASLGGMPVIPSASVPQVSVPAEEGAQTDASAARPAVRDPFLSSLEKIWEANPVQHVLPINWVEISRSLQTLWAREMADPSKALERAAEYNMRLANATMETWQEAARRFWGLPTSQDDAEDAEAGRPDKRFKAPEWETNPFYATLRQNYELASEYLLKEIEETGAQDGEEERKLRFHLQQFVDAMAPVNFFLSNPEAIKRAVETGGASVADGVRNLMTDLKEGRLSMTDATAFEPGENLANTPGKVVFRNELIELIQYAPTTEKVRETPVMFIPPWINKYYILDLQPKNSFVKYLVDQGYTVFMISWKNPDASMESTKFEDYMHKGPLAAAEVVREITGAEKVNPVGYCVGGTLLAVALAWLAEGGDENPFGSPTFMVSLQDFTDVGDTEFFVDEPQIELMEQQMMERGYLDNRKMANMFNLLRSNDLIWSNVVNNYLLGQKPPAFDLLYWNADGTRMARDAHSFYLRNTYLENNLIKPGKVKIEGRKIDLGRLEGDMYAVGAEKDHIVPWNSAWKISKITDGTVRFTLANSGHIAGMINPPSKGKGRYWATENGGTFDTAEDWREKAKEHEGSWWEDWTKWLEKRSGKKTKPPKMGSAKNKPIEDAPGTYVKET